MKYRNFTPHQINLNDGRTFSSEGCARVSAAFTEIVGDACRQTFGDVQGLPEWEEGTRIIVSAMVMAASDSHQCLSANSPVRTFLETLHARYLQFFSVTNAFRLIVLFGQT